MLSSSASNREVIDLTQEDNDDVDLEEETVYARSTPGFSSQSLRTTQSRASAESLEGYNKENRTYSGSSGEEEEEDDEDDDVQTGAQVFRNRRKRIRSTTSTNADQEGENLSRWTTCNLNEERRKQASSRRSKHQKQVDVERINDMHNEGRMSSYNAAKHCSSKSKQRSDSKTIGLSRTNGLSLEPVLATQEDSPCRLEEPRVAEPKAKRVSSKPHRKDTNRADQHHDTSGGSLSSHGQFFDPPNTPEELCIRPKKLRELRTWLETAVHNSLQHATPSLLFLVGPPGVGKSTAISVLTKSLGIESMEWIDNGSRGGSPNENTPELRFDYVSVLASFKSFLSASSQFPSLLLAEGENASTDNTGGMPHLLLLHDVPRGSNSSVETREYVRRQVEEGLRKYLTYGKYPLVVIISSGDQDEDSPSANTVHKLVSNEVANHSRTTIMEVRPVTNARMKSVLWSLLEGNQRKSRGKRDTRTSQPIEHAVQSANGDLRHAIYTLYFWTHGGHKSGASSAPSCGRDRFVGMLHSLGKLLYAKRNERGELENDHEQIAADSGLDPGALASFMHENCAELFAGVDTLSRTMDSLCIGDVIQSSKYRSGLSGRNAASLRGHEQSLETDTTHNTGQAIFPDSYANCIFSRSISSYNHSPLSSGFKKLSKPAAFEMERHRRNNYRWIAFGGLGWSHGVKSEWVHGANNEDRQSVEMRESRCCFDTSRNRCLWKIPYLHRLISYQSPAALEAPDLERKLIQSACSYGSTTETKRFSWDYGINLSGNGQTLGASPDENSEEIED
eukprot:gb/GECG01013149.1/.p1 GENE.gb/GECG01013149.1/~~gb/GECG01013149.1/.p1  ORF type:complete len:790 (+),score=109.36 gb/GECG01013149.1/:1-2370(+)